MARPESDRGLRGEDEVEVEDEVESGGWRYGPWLVAATFGLIVVATAAYFLRITGGSWFFVDEWSMALQLERPGGIIEPYNGHLSVSILSLYRVLLELFGFSYLPYRVAGVVALVAVPVAMFLVARRRVGAPLAAVMGLVLLWARDVSFEPGGLNHSLVLVGAIVCAGALSGRGRRSDLLVGASLAFALCGAGGGVAVAAAAVVHSVCTRASRGRWLAVLLPAGAWFVWWRAMAPPEPPFVREFRPGVRELLGDALQLAGESFRYLVLGNRALGVVLLCVFAIHAAWRLRAGPAAAANVLAWTSALVVWWFGLMWSRWVMLSTLDQPPFRYRFLAVGFILLAVIPPAGTALPRRLAGATRRSAVLATAGVVVVAAVLVVAVRPDAQHFARRSATYGRLVRAKAAMVVDPTASASIPEDEDLGFSFGNLTASEARRVLGNYGSDLGSAPIDERLVEMRVVRLARGRRNAAPEACEPLQGPVDLGSEDAIRIHAASGPTDVTVRRFGREWVTVGRLAGRQMGTLFLPAHHAREPWQVRGDGLCMVIEPDR